jgi:hypothetical protein
MPLVPGPGPPFDALGNHVENRWGRLCLSRFLPSSCLPAPVRRGRPNPQARNGLVFRGKSLGSEGMRDATSRIPAGPVMGAISVLWGDTEIAAALSHVHPSVPSSLSPHGLSVCSADARERPASGLRVNQRSPMSEDDGACPRVEDDLLSPIRKLVDWLVLESAVQSAP